MARIPETELERLKTEVSVSQGRGDGVIVIDIAGRDARRGGWPDADRQLAIEPMACSTVERWAAKREARCVRPSTSRSSASSTGEVTSSMSPAAAASISL